MAGTHARRLRGVAQVALWVIWFERGPDSSNKENAIMEPLNLALPEWLRMQWPYRPRYARVNGYRMHYIDEGQGDPVVLLHGNPTWGFLYREFVGPLTAAGYRVIVPDMIGFPECFHGARPMGPLSDPICSAGMPRS